MEHTNPTNINIYVDDENSLYSKFSPNDFDNPAKNFIKSKISVQKNIENLSLTVISKKPINEERFRAAVSNWIDDEKSLFKADQQNQIFTLLALLAFGSLMIILSISMEQHNSSIKYSLLPIIGSLSLSKAANIIILDLPAIRAKKWVANKMEEKNAISFIYDNGGMKEDPSQEPSC